MQIDPMTAEAFERVRDKEWMPMAGVGDKAYFRDNKARFAELFVQAGTHVMTIQMDVPDGKTSACIGGEVRPAEHELCGVRIITSLARGA